MKKRIKIDSSILSFIIILTGLLYQFPQLYTHGLMMDDIFDFIGLFVVLMGIFLRMAARGFKKAHSGKGQELVVSGPYALVRNPMYLGSFLMGSGFIFIVWPWWSLAFFAILFYLRFNKQMIKEERLLSEFFGQDYEKYTGKVPRIFPTLSHFKKIRFKEIFPFELSWNTKEKWGLLGWFLLAIFLEIFQEKVVYGIMDVGNAVYIFLLSAVAFILAVWSLYRNA